MEGLGIPLPRPDPPRRLAGGAVIAVFRSDGPLIGLIQQGAIAEFPQQSQFKLTQAGFEMGTARQVLQGGMVKGKQSRMGIAPLQEPGKQFVEVEATEKGLAHQGQGRAGGLGAGQGPDLTAPRPACPEGVEGLKDGALGGATPLGPLRQDRQPPRLGAEEVEEQAGIAIVAPVEDEAALQRLTGYGDHG